MQRPSSCHTPVVASPAVEDTKWPSGDALARLLPFTDTVTLTYCYRMTSEILGYSAAVLRRLHTGFVGKRFQDQHHIDSRRDAASARMTAVITGPEVEEVVVAEDDLVELAVDRALALRQPSGAWDGIGIVVVGESGPMIDALRQRGVPASSPAEVKGLEFFRGIIVDRLGPYTGGNGRIPTTSAGYRAESGLYVAATRFRDQVTLITSHSARFVGKTP